MAQGREPDDGLREQLDALEEKVLGERMDQVRDEERDPEPAFDQDVDPRDPEADERERGSGAEPP